MQIIRNKYAAVFPGLIRKSGPLHAIIIGARETSCGDVLRILSRGVPIQAFWIQEDLKKALAHLILCDRDICRRAFGELMAKNDIASRET